MTVLQLASRSAAFAVLTWEIFDDALVFGTVLPWLLIAVGTWLGYQLVRQNGRILLRLESIEKQLAPCAGAKQQEAGGLPLGTARTGL